MAQARFPEPQDLRLPVKDLIGDGSNHMVHPEYTLDRPHPGYGKDPNIINHLGHTKYPKFITKANGIDKVVVHNAEEEAEALYEVVDEPSLSSPPPIQANWK